MLTVELLCCFAQVIQESCQASPREAEASTSKGGMFKTVNLTYFLCCYLTAFVTAFDALHHYWCKICSRCAFRSSNGGALLKWGVVA